jgi:hypothetical protein
MATLCSVGGGATFIGLFLGAPGIGRLWPLTLFPILLGGVVLLMFVGAFLKLAWRPEPWGKYICAVGLPWIGFSVISRVVAQASGGAFLGSPMLLLPGIAGAVLLLVGLVLLLTDGTGAPVKDIGAEYGDPSPRVPAQAPDAPQ